MENFDKLDSFGIPFTKNQIFFNSMLLFDFESVSVENDKFENMEARTLIEKNIPTSVSMSSISLPETLFLCNPNPGDLVTIFIDALDSLATKIKTQKIVNFHQLETPMRRNLHVS